MVKSAILTSTTIGLDKKEKTALKDSFLKLVRVAEQSSD